MRIALAKAIKSGFGTELFPESLTFDEDISTAFYSSKRTRNIFVIRSPTQSEDSRLVKLRFYFTPKLKK